MCSEQSQLGGGAVEEFDCDAKAASAVDSFSEIEGCFGNG
jgi:hypothetical protein